MKENDIYQVKIESFDVNGYGVCHIDNKVVFVLYALEGEEVKIKITNIHKKYVFSEAIEIIKKSPHRILSLEEINNLSGECDLSHIDYETELKIKELKNKIKGTDKLNNKIKNDCYILNKLNFIVDYIQDKCSLIFINNILQENIIEFIIKINEENQNKLFSSILSLKRKFDFIDEISLNMQSLENILIHL